MNTRNLTLLCLSILSLTPAYAQNSPIPLSQEIHDLKDRNLAQVLGEFLEFSKIYRRSDEEGTVRNYLIAIADEKKYTYSVDDGGNLTVTLPGTGKFSKSSRYIALQGHMDIVPDVNGLKSGEASRPYFRHPLDLVVDQGHLVESRNH